jgi:uncharacterized protein YydD (DUF2326 family)
MIRRIYSDHPRFRTVTLRPGMNILVATKNPNASRLDTRNGAGKSSLIEILHFVFGGDCDKTSIFRDEELVRDTYGVECDLRPGVTISAERSGERPGRVIVRNLPPGLVESTRRDTGLFDDDGAANISVREWNRLLGASWFDLKSSPDEADRLFAPSFRALFPYFCRRPAGFESPSKTHSKQLLWQEQVDVSFLIGLDWRIPQNYQRIRAKQRFRVELKKALKKSGHDATAIPSSSALQTALALAENRADELERALADFRVVDEYNQLEQEGGRLAQRLGRIADENSVDRGTIADLEAVQEYEAPNRSIELEDIYREALIVLPKKVKKQFDDVHAFHESVVRNRQEYLRAEIADANDRVAKRTTEQREIERRQAQIWRTLKNAGALETFTSLQVEFARVHGAVNSLRTQFENASAFESTGREIKREQSQLEDQLALNHKEQREQINKAIVVFDNVSRRLYAEPGHLRVSTTLAGPPITVEIPRSRSEGVASMQIFCFDLTMVQICQDRALGPRFLVHDSHLFDPVDGRQVGQALGVAAELCNSENATFQYFTMLNSDKLEKVQEETSQSLEQWILSTQLSDDPHGGLFGRPFSAKVMKG